MRFSLEYYLNSFFGFYLTFYSLFIIIILIGTTFFKGTYKTESFNLLYTFNTLAAWSSLMVLVLLFDELFVAWYGQNPYEWYAFRENNSFISWSWIFIINILSAVLGLLLFFRKLRISRLFTFLYFLTFSLFLFERVIIYITSLYRDYLPSSWSTNYINRYPKNLYSMAVIILMLVMIYLHAKKKGRLPFPSVFLK